MRTKNLCSQDFSLHDIYFLLKDKKFYQELVQILKSRFFYDKTVYSFSLYHNDLDTLQKLFKAEPYLLEKFKFSYLKGKIFNVNSFKAKEYHPLINPRVHDLSSRSISIRDKDFKQTYLQFLIYLSEKSIPNHEDNLILSMYLLLQDRIDDALKVFEKIESDKLNRGLEIQYDYMKAYYNLYTGYPDFKVADQICEKYLSYPVLEWRNKFIDLANQLAEFFGDAEITGNVGKTRKDQQNQKEAEKTEYFEIELVDSKTTNDEMKDQPSENSINSFKKELKLTHKNIEHLNISYYQIDLEIMFSRQPFMQENSKDYSFVKANLYQQVNVNKSSKFESMNIDIPLSLENKNLFIQVTSGAITKNLTYFPTKMDIYIISKFGQVKVTDTVTHKPISRVYIKCFSKNSEGKTEFYKDGYTDLRGTFDYATLNSDDLKSIDKFALLIMGTDSNYGAVIKEVKPPKIINDKKVEAKKLMSKDWQQRQNVVSKKMKNNTYALF